MNDVKPKPKKRGLKLTLVGILIGVLTGFGILGLESFIADELRDLLNEEAAKACNCSFDASSISISLLTMRGTAMDARILRDGEPRLIFKQVDAAFSLSRASEQLIVLSDLHLQDGVAYDVDEESVTFQLVDSLSAPPPPEREKEKRWKLFLEQLRVSGSRFSQDFPGTYITGNSISLFMDRNQNSDFELRPTIGDLKLILKKTKNRPFEKTIELGKVTSRLTLEDSQAIFRKLQLITNKSIVKIDAISNIDEGNALSGNAKMNLETSLLQLGDFIQTELTAKSTLSGSLGNPGMQGSFSLKEKDETHFSIEGIPIFSIDGIDGEFTYDMNHGKHLLRVPTLQASGPGTRAWADREIRIDDDAISAAFSIAVDEFRTEGIVISGIQASVSLSNTLDDIQFVVEGSSQRTTAGDFFLPPLDFKVQNTPTLSFLVKHNSISGGAFNVSGSIDSSSGDPILKDGFLELKNLSIFQELDDQEREDPDTLKKVRLSGSTSLSGPLSLYELNGEGEITLASRHFAGEAALTGTVAIQDGTLSTKVYNRTESLQAALDLHFLESRGTGKLTLRDFKPTEYYPDARCFEISADTSYQFSFADPKSGDGTIALSRLLLGCAPYSVTLEEPAAVPIQNGEAVVSSLVLSSAASDFVVKGSANPKNLDLTADGSLFLNTFLGFIPALDDLSGSLDARLSVTGSPDSPIIDGSATISDGEFSSEASDIIASNLQGAIRLSAGAIAVEYLTGTVNNGTIAIDGQADLNNLPEASLTIDIQQMVINTIPDVAATVSASLVISPGEQAPSIEGSIFIDSLEARKEINLSSLVKAIVKDPVKRAASASFKDLPAADLAITINAPRNIFLYSNFLNAEFGADMSLAGTLNAPRVSGNLTSQSGWLGLKNRRFDITSGVITFTDDPTNPNIELIGETSVFGKTGEFVTIILETSGTLAAPEIELTSDTGLTQAEILNLLTSSLRNLERTRANNLSEQDSSGAISLVDERPGSALRAMLHKLTTLDDLSVEPALNNRTGAIEPALTATKRLTDNIAIIGDTFVGTEPSSRLRVQYDLTPYLNIAGLVDSINTEQNSSLGVDLTYTVFARKVPFIAFEFTGNETFDAIDILRGVRLNGDSRIRAEELPELTSRFEKYFHDRGYLHALAVLHCDTYESFCRTLRIQLFEGPKAEIRTREIIGDTLPPEIPESRLPSISSGQAATEELRAYQQQALIELLRSEGYLTARARAYYQETTTHDVNLVVNLSVGSQDSFVFEGNSVFSPEEFLETINLFNRKQPFGRNTIHILVENIERMYREAGYLFASIDFVKTVDPQSKKTTFVVQIQEEVPVQITSTRLIGNEKITSNQLKQLFKDKLPEEYAAVFEPKTLVAERMDDSCRLLKAMYHSEGYPNASVNYVVFPGDNDDEITLEYVISEGTPLIFDKITLINFPDEVTAPKIDAAVLSIPRVNLYLSSLITTLRDNGFRAATVESVYEDNRLLVVVTPGATTTIGTIRIEGAAQVPEELVLTNLTFKSGSRLRREDLHQSRRALLLLGLFSRVEILTVNPDDNSETEDILVRVVERSLTTLEVGGGLNSELGVHTFGEAVDKSIFLDGSSIGVRLDLFVDEQDGGVNQGVAGLRYTQPRFLDFDFQLTQDARFQKTDLTTLEYDLERYILDSSMYRRFWGSGSLNLSYSLLQDNVSNVPDDAQLSHLDEGIVNLSLFGTTLRWDDRDSPVIPTSGFAASLDTRFTAKGVGSDANFYSLGGRVSYLHPISNSPFSIAEHMRVASAWTFGGTEAIPITQRYYLGGRQSVRGFRENSLGPSGAEGSVIGGDILLQNNFEFRYRLQETLSTHVFFDAGNVFLRSEDFDLEDLRTSVGLGARYLSPIGPIGFDLGTPLDEKEGEPSVRLHFSIGATF